VTGPALARPTAAVSAALALLPAAPGVYRMRDARGRVLYTGRSGDLRTRVRSYWRDLRDRPHLAPMLRSVAWVEPTVCESEHEAALFERHLLMRHRPPYNRTTGQGQLVHLRLSTDPAAPSLDPVVLEPASVPGGELYGPYLGWEPSRLASAALNRLFPIRYTAGGLDPSRRELARSRGVGEQDLRTLASRIGAVLERRPRALAGALARLTELREQAAADLQFEAAAELQRQLEALRWIAQARPRPRAAGDVDVWAPAESAAVLLRIRSGDLEDCVVCGAAGMASYYAGRPRPGRVLTCGAGPAAGADDAAWLAVAEANASLTDRLIAAGARPQPAGAAPSRARTGSLV
jgi:excinuclease UvrABC nuclease subunit